ncbi:YceI family protein [Pseudochryseolinea flava]|uniref:YceI family protein n=1 Tax=Pseudochryseolinea flava TaxID=2059302 RepID=A0A364Y2T2_9BACT|nr:YceI family protein [Pseudochryseolinea flava]RAW00622.1 YceI family protein [Pseudochryseolinea flava]
MNTKTVFKSFAILLGLAGLFAFTPKPTKFQVDTKSSTLLWTARKVTGSHNGAVPIAAGELVIDGKNITQGNFEIDLSGLTVADITNPESNARLVGHLKGEDFFSTEKFPKANFVLTSAALKSGQEYLVKGKLTIKGITNDIEFPATIVKEAKKVTATAKITIDRTKYDIRYRSKNFFENLGDKAIEDNFDLDLKLVAVAGGI